MCPREARSDANERNVSASVLCAGVGWRTLMSVEAADVAREDVLAAIERRNAEMSGPAEGMYSQLGWSAAASGGEDGGGGEWGE